MQTGAPIIAQRSALSRRAPAVALAAAVWLVSGCLTKNDAYVEQSDPSRSPNIVNGSTYSGMPSVGQLRTSHALCTATLVGYHTVLTAAHCIGSGSMWFLTDDGKRYTVAKKYVHPGYETGGKKNYGNDIAVVQLASEPSAKPSRVAESAPGFLSKVTLIGFGITATGKKDYGTKRKGTTRVHIKTSKKLGFLAGFWSMSNICNGDSGGPTFAENDDEQVVVGVHSHTIYGCGKSGWDTRTDAHLDWLKKVAGGDLFTTSTQPKKKPAPTQPPKTKTSPDTEAPQVEITSPKASAHVGSSVVVEVIAKDDRSVKDLRMMVDGHTTHVRYGSSAKFKVNLLAGRHKLRVEARDAAGNRGSAEVVVQSGQTAVDATPPTVRFTDMGLADDGSGQYAISGLASDDTAIARVELWVDGKKRGTSTGPAAEFTVELPEGQTKLELRAYDRAGNVGKATATLDTTAPTTTTATDDLGGCAVGGGAGSLPLSTALVLLGLVVVGLRRRRS